MRVDGDGVMRNFAITTGRSKPWVENQRISQVDGSHLSRNIALEAHEVVSKAGEPLSTAIVVRVARDKTLSSI